MTSWQSPLVPDYIDKDAVFATVYATFFTQAPKKSGRMAEGIDYTATGDSSYWWDDVIYAGYQDTVTSYRGWWSEDLPATFDRVLEQYERFARDEDQIPEWMADIVDKAVENT